MLNTYKAFVTGEERMKKYRFIAIPILLLLALAGWRFIPRMRPSNRLSSGEIIQSTAQTGIRPYAGEPDIIQTVQGTDGAIPPDDNPLSLKSTGKKIYLDNKAVKSHLPGKAQ